MDKKKKTSKADFKKRVDTLTKLFNASSDENQESRIAITEMIEGCKELIELYPSSSEPHFMLGLLAFKLGDEGQAIESCEIAHKIDPEVRDYAEALSVICASVGKLAEGMYYAKITPSLTPHSFMKPALPPHLHNFETALSAAKPSKHFVEASRFFNVADYPSALKECSAELRINQRNLKAYILFAKTLLIVKSFSQATSALHAAILIDPNSALPRSLLARSLCNLGNFSEATSVAKTAINIIMRNSTNDNTEAFAHAMDALLKCPEFPIKKAKELAIKFQQKFSDENPLEPTDSIETKADNNIKVGLISNAFFRNKDSLIFKSWFPSNPSKNVSLLGYQQSVATDTVTTNIIQACEHWREIYNTDPFTLDITMKADELDILLDLSNTERNPRLEIMGTNSSKYRVGSFCLSEPGFAPGISHILCDDILITASKDVLLDHQERILINGTLFAREPYFALSNSQPLPLDHNGYVTFGGVIDLIKLSPDCAQLWSQILHEIPNSRLFLCGSEQANHQIKEQVCEYFAHSGLTNRLMFPEASSIDTEPPVELVEASIPNSHWGEIDIFLDTTPFNGTNELCEALWTGAPVISLKSNQRSGLFGASILTAAKRLNWIASTPEQYVKTAVKLAKDPDHLRKERIRLQENMANTALFDSKALNNELIKSFRELAQKN